MDAGRAGARPRQGDPEATYLTRLARWLDDHQIPRRFFTRTLSTGGRSGKNRKPLYVDVTNHFLLTSFIRSIAHPDEQMLLEESLPDPADAPRYGTDNRVRPRHLRDPPVTPRTPRPVSSRWVCAHVFHAGDLDRLITRMAGPLTTDLKPDRFFFLRYWEGGPHLRVRLHVTGPRDAERTRREIAGRGRAYLAAHPSTRALTPDQYARMASSQARAERMAGHDARLHPNDSVEFVDYHPEHHAYGDPNCMGAVETHFTHSSRITLDILRTQPGPERRAAAGLAVTLTLASCHAAPCAEPAAPPIAEGRLMQPPRYDERRAAERPSGLHRMMFGNRAYHRAVFDDPAFGRYRLCLNYTYLHINRLGLTPPQRFRLCHLAANAVEDVYGVNAVETVRRYTGAHPNQPT